MPRSHVFPYTKHFQNNLVLLGSVGIQKRKKIVLGIIQDAC